MSHRHSLDHHVTVNDPRDLARIRHAATNFVVWPRPTPPWMQTLGGRPLTPVDAHASLESAFSPVEPLVEPLRKMLGSVGSATLARDVRMLAAYFFEATHACCIEARLSVMTDDGCRKFHVDRRHARLLCTYLGPGTEWVPNRAVDREALCMESDDMARANDAVVRDWSQVRCMPRGWIAILKGELWRGNEGRGIVHRSPPIAALGLTRLVLTMDAHV